MKLALIALLALPMLTLSACFGAVSPPAEEAVYQKVSAEEARAILDGESSYTLLDVRTDEEFEDRHIDGALLIPDYEIAQRAEAELPGKDALILVYCRSGRRSANAAKELISMGYTRVLDFGGIIDWPYETVSGAAPSAQNVP